MAMAFTVKPIGLSRHLLLNPTSLLTVAKPLVPAPRLYSTSNSFPKIAQTSVWTSMIPKFIRNRGARKEDASKEKSKEWNPATFYIIIFTLIGSQAIRMMSLKNDYAAYRRTTDAKLELLREVIERVKRGEKVDVEKLLGTVLREIEEEDSLWHRKANRSETTQQSEKDQKQPTQKSEGKDSVTPSTASADDETMKKTQSTRKLNFF